MRFLRKVHHLQINNKTPDKQKDGLALCDSKISIKLGVFFLLSHFAFYGCKWSKSQKPVTPQLGCQSTPKGGKQRSPEGPPVSASASHPCTSGKGTKTTDGAVRYELKRSNFKQKLLISTFPQIKTQLQRAHAPHVPSSSQAPGSQRH